MNVAALLGGACSRDYRAQGSLLQCCADRGLRLAGRQVHARILLAGTVPGNYLASKLLTFYSRCGRTADARNVFDEIPHRNLFAWNAMLFAYALHDRPADALLLFSHFPHSLLVPDAFCLSALLKSASSVPGDSYKEVHAFAVRRGLGGDVFVANGLVTAYSRAGDLQSARRVFDGMRDRDVVSWNSIISGYSNSGHYDACLELYEKMVKQVTITPNGVTVASVLQACSQIKDLGFGARVHRFTIENMIEMDTMVWNSIVGLYAKCGRLDYARWLFEQVPSKDDASFSTMISGYMSYGLVNDAMDLFRSSYCSGLSTWNAVISGMVQNNQHDNAVGLAREMQDWVLRLTPITLSSVLSALSFYSNLVGGKEIHCHAIRNGHDQNIFVATSLIDAYAKGGFLDGARSVFDGNKSKSVVLWTAIVSAYAGHGDAHAALDLFNSMLISKNPPDHVIFTAVLTACAHAGMLEDARRIFNAMLPEHGVVPGVEHYACIVTALSRAGMLQESIEFIRSMPLTPNAKAWGALLNGAAVSGDAEVGRFAFNELLAMEPENTGNYIIMANIYSRIGKWEEAEEVRGKLKRVGLAKVPGCSWIETSKGPKVFLAHAVSNRDLDDIYVVLGQFTGLILEESYVYNTEFDYNLWAVEMKNS